MGNMSGQAIRKSGEKRKGELRSITQMKYRKKKGNTRSLKRSEMNQCEERK